MKFVTAIIKPSKLDAARVALMETRVSGMTISEVQGFGRQKGRVETYRGAEYVVGYLPKIRLEIAVEDDQLDHVLEALMKSARTGAIGDGKIFITDLAQVIRIRSGETGSAAL